MVNIQTLECKFCGRELDLRKEQNNVIVCSSCKRVHTLPRKEISTTALNFLLTGEHDLGTCKFDEAYVAYQKAAEYDEQEPEAYWGMAISEFRVGLYLFAY